MPHALREARECGPFFFWCRRRRININESVLCFQNAGLQDLSHPDSFRAMCSLSLILMAVKECSVESAPRFYFLWGSVASLEKHCVAWDIPVHVAS